MNNKEKLNWYYKKFNTKSIELISNLEATFIETSHKIINNKIYSGRVNAFIRPYAEQITEDFIKYLDKLNIDTKILQNSINLINKNNVDNFGIGVSKSLYKIFFSLNNPEVVTNILKLKNLKIEVEKSDATLLVFEASKTSKMHIKPYYWYNLTTKRDKNLDIILKTHNEKLKTFLDISTNFFILHIKDDTRYYFTNANHNKALALLNNKVAATLANEYLTLGMPLREFGILKSDLQKNIFNDINVYF